MILLVSDLDLHGSGYLNIAIALSKELHTRGRNLTVLGIGYDGAEHSWPFQIIPVDPNAAWQGVSAMVNNFDALGQKGQHEAIEAIVIALDIPHHQQGLRLVNGRWPYIGIFPVESGPVRRSWAAIVASMSARLVISEFGKDCLRDAGITSEHLRVGVDMEAWRPAKPELTDTKVHVVKAEADGRLLGFFSNFGCHPVVCSEETRYIHGDYCGVATNRKFARHVPDVVLPPLGPVGPRGFHYPPELYYPSVLAANPGRRVVLTADCLEFLPKQAYRILRDTAFSGNVWKINEVCSYKASYRIFCLL
jgi:hypothetical protein